MWNYFAKTSAQKSMDDEIEFNQLPDGLIETNLRVYAGDVLIAEFAFLADDKIDNKTLRKFSRITYANYTRNLSGNTH